MKLSDNVIYILDTLEDAGYRADIVGGPVRDFLLGKEPHDYDITTSATPEEIKHVFSGKRTVDTGIAHGTVTLVLDSEPYEITTYRIDGEYTDARHPDSVTFTTDITEDLSRRDFTVNAISYSPRHGFCDPFSGKTDIEHGLLRAVGDPYARFSEDALRILRCIRFSSVLGFEVEECTASAARELAHTLTRISAERVYSEWMKLLGGKNAYRVITRFSDIIEVFLPELCGIIMPDEKNFTELSADMRQLLLFASVKERSPKCSANAFSSAMKRLRSPTRIREDGEAVLGALGSLSVRSLGDGGRLLSLMGLERSREMLSLDIIMGYTSSDALSILDEYIGSKRPYRIADLALNGYDVISLGAGGSRVGMILSSLLSFVIEGTLENDRDALLERAKELLGMSAV